MMPLCFDYCRLNIVIPADAHPMPWIDDLIDQLGEANHISTLDLSRGYWQVPVAEEDTECSSQANQQNILYFYFLHIWLVLGQDTMYVQDLCNRLRSSSSSLYKEGREVYRHLVVSVCVDGTRRPKSQLCLGEQQQNTVSNTSCHSLLQ